MTIQKDSRLNDSEVWEEFDYDLLSWHPLHNLCFVLYFRNCSIKYISEYFIAVLLKSIFMQFLTQFVKIHFWPTSEDSSQDLHWCIHILICCIYSRGTCFRIAVLIVFVTFWPLLILDMNSASSLLCNAFANIFVFWFRLSQVWWWA